MHDLGVRLRAGDPLRCEPSPDGRARRHVMAVVAAESRVVHASVVPRRRLSVLVFVAVVALAGVAAWGTWRQPVLAAVRFEARLAEDRPADGLRELPVGTDARVVYVHDASVITNDDIIDARAMPDPSGHSWRVEVRVSPAGSERLRLATAQHIGRPLALMMDGLVVAAPVVRSAVAEVGVLSGRYTRGEAERLAQGLRLRGR